MPGIYVIESGGIDTAFENLGTDIIGLWSGQAPPGNSQTLPKIAIALYTTVPDDA